MGYKAGLAVLLLMFTSPADMLQAAVTQSVNEDNGLRSWRLLDGDIEIELIQRLPDQTRAMFMNYEFSRDVIEQLANSCMFQTIIRNTGASGSGRAIEIDLTSWRMRYDGKEQALLLKESLLESWTDEDADRSAKVVVRWAMFPTRQEYLTSDYNWGLTAYGVPPGAMFDLSVAWVDGGRQQTGYIPGIVCAPDVDRLK